MLRCNYELAWRGQCKETAVIDGYCEKHITINCRCGEKAVAECEHTGVLVCGEPTCSDEWYCHTHIPKNTMGL